MPIAPDFRIGQRVVYPSNGVGEMVNIDTQTIDGTAIQASVCHIISSGRNDS